MMRLMIASILLLTSSTALGQAVGGPPIAYVTAGTKGDQIYLVYPDGTGLTKVYEAPSSGRIASRIDRVSIKPGGGEVAFVQDSAHLLIQRHDAYGHPLGAAYEVDVPSPACALYDPDYRSDGYLVFVRGCAAPDVRIVAPGATASSQLFPLERDIAGEAALGTSLVYVDIAGGQSNAARLQMRSADGTKTTIASTTFQFPYFVDANAAKNVAVLSDPRGYRLIDLGTGAASAGCTSADLVKYSPTGSEMIYRYRDVLFVHKTNCSGAPFRLGRGAKSAAWRSN